MILKDAERCWMLNKVWLPSNIHTTFSCFQQCWKTLNPFDEGLIFPMNITHFQSYPLSFCINQHKVHVHLSLHITAHKKPTLISSSELALFSCSSSLIFVNSAMHRSRFLQFSDSCWICFSFASKSSCFFLVSCLNVSAWFCNFSL